MSSDPVALDLAGGVLLALALAMLAVRRPAAQARAAALQSLVLAVAAVWQSVGRGQPVLLLAALAALAGMAVALAAPGGRNLDRGPVLLGAALAVLAVAALQRAEPAGLRDVLGLGLATVLAGVAATARRAAAAQALGLLTMQNGVALVALGMGRPWLAVAAATPLLPGIVLLRRVVPR
jgi:hydrogenase-4 membrane subunit HyfE